MSNDDDTMKAYAQIWEGKYEPDLGYISWDGYLMLCEHLGMTPDPDLIVGMAVMLVKGEKPVSLRDGYE